MLLGLRVGDPHAEVLIDKAIAGCAADDVAEVVSLAKPLTSWRTEILAHHDTGAHQKPLSPLRRVEPPNSGSYFLRISIMTSLHSGCRHTSRGCPVLW